MMNQQIDIRPATIADSKEIARVHAIVQAQTYQGYLPTNLLLVAQKDLSGLEKHHLSKIQQTFEQDGCVYVAETSSKEMVGFVYAGPRRDGPNEYGAELYNIFVLGEYQRQKIGSKLFYAVVNFLMKQNFTNLLLWYTKGTAAREFYDSLNGKAIAKREESIANQSITLECYGWPDLAHLGFGNF